MYQNNVNPLRRARAAPSAKVWFPYSCASAHTIYRGGVAGRTQAHMDGKRKTPVVSAVGAWEGRSILPNKSAMLSQRLMGHFPC
jgi:hypothetical protein